MPGPIDLQLRLDYLALGASDLERLAALRPLFEKHATTLVDSFYQHLISFSETRRFLVDPAVRERLNRAQRDYLLSLAGPTIDDEYIAQRRSIGEIHERIGLEPRWYLGAYALYVSLLVPLILDYYPQDPIEAGRAIAALQKRLCFDAEVATEVYIDIQQRQLQYYTGELAKESRRLARNFETQRVELQLTEKRARVAEELVSVATLVAGLAHEIGTPMGVIQGHANQLESAVSDENAKWRLRTIQEQVSRISKIIQTLLNMARPGKARHVLVSLESVVEMTLAFLTEEFSRRGIEIHTDLHSAPNVLGDPERLQQLFLNLFMNAVDAMPGGGELRVGLTTAPDGEIQIAVGDTGQGIPERDLPRIFEPFFTSKEAGTGNGLGLMVAKGIVKDHGGSMTVKSREGEGTEFRILLPRVEASSS